MTAGAMVIVPTYNERANLPVLIAELMKQAGVRVLVVDDHSPDGTGEVADQLAREHSGRIDGSAPHRPPRPGPVLHRRHQAGARRAG